MVNHSSEVKRVTPFGEFGFTAYPHPDTKTLPSLFIDTEDTGNMFLSTNFLDSLVKRFHGFYNLYTEAFYIDPYDNTNERYRQKTAKGDYVSLEEMGAVLKAARKQAYHLQGTRLSALQFMIEGHEEVGRQCVGFCAEQFLQMKDRWLDHGRYAHCSHEMLLRMNDILMVMQSQLQKAIEDYKRNEASIKKRIGNHSILTYFQSMLEAIKLEYLCIHECMYERLALLDRTADISSGDVLFHDSKQLANLGVKGDCSKVDPKTQLRLTAKTFHNFHKILFEQADEALQTKVLGLSWFPEKISKEQAQSVLQPSDSQVSLHAWAQLTLARKKMLELRNKCANKWCLAELIKATSHFEECWIAVNEEIKLGKCIPGLDTIETSTQQLNGLLTTEIEGHGAFLGNLPVFIEKTPIANVQTTLHDVNLLKTLRLTQDEVNIAKLGPVQAACQTLIAIAKPRLQKLEPIRSHMALITLMSAVDSSKRNLNKVLAQKPKPTPKELAKAIEDFIASAHKLKQQLCEYETLTTKDMALYEGCQAYLAQLSEGIPAAARKYKSVDTFLEDLKPYKSYGSSKKLNKLRDYRAIIPLMDTIDNLVTHLIPADNFSDRSIKIFNTAVINLCKLLRIYGKDNKILLAAGEAFIESLSEKVQYQLVDAYNPLRPMNQKLFELNLRLKMGLGGVLEHDDSLTTAMSEVLSRANTGFACPTLPKTSAEVPKFQAELSARAVVASKLYEESHTAHNQRLISRHRPEDNLTEAKIELQKFYGFGGWIKRRVYKEKFKTAQFRVQHAWSDIAKISFFENLRTMSDTEAYSRLKQLANDTLAYRGINKLIDEPHEFRLKEITDVIDSVDFYIGIQGYKELLTERIATLANMVLNYLLSIEGAPETELEKAKLGRLKLRLAFFTTNSSTAKEPKIVTEARHKLFDAFKNTLFELKTDDALSRLRLACEHTDISTLEARCGRKAPSLVQIEAYLILKNCIENPKQTLSIKEIQKVQECIQSTLTRNDNTHHPFRLKLEASLAVLDSKINWQCCSDEEQMESIKGLLQIFQTRGVLPSNVADLRNALYKKAIDSLVPIFIQQHNAQDAIARLAAIKSCFEDVACDNLFASYKNYEEITAFYEAWGKAGAVISEWSNREAKSTDDIHEFYKFLKIVFTFGYPDLEETHQNLFEILEGCISDVKQWSASPSEDKVKEIQTKLTILKQEGIDTTPNERFKKALLGLKAKLIQFIVSQIEAMDFIKANEYHVLLKKVWPDNPLPIDFQKEFDKKIETKLSLGLRKSLVEADRQLDYLLNGAPSTLTSLLQMFSLVDISDIDESQMPKVLSIASHYIRVLKSVKNELGKDTSTIMRRYFDSKVQPAAEQCRALLAEISADVKHGNQDQSSRKLKPKTLFALLYLLNQFTTELGILEDSGLIKQLMMELSYAAKESPDFIHEFIGQLTKTELVELERMYQCNQLVFIFHPVSSNGEPEDVDDPTIDEESHDTTIALEDIDPTEMQRHQQTLAQENRALVFNTTIAVFAPLFANYLSGNLLSHQEKTTLSTKEQASLLKQREALLREQIAYIDERYQGKQEALLEEDNAPFLRQRLIEALEQSDRQLASDCIFSEVMKYSDVVDKMNQLRRLEFAKIGASADELSNRNIDLNLLARLHKTPTQNKAAILRLENRLKLENTTVESIAREIASTEAKLQKAVPLEKLKTHFDKGDTPTLLDIVLDIPDDLVREYDKPVKAEMRVLETKYRPIISKHEAKTRAAIQANPEIEALFKKMGLCLYDFCNNAVAYAKDLQLSAEEQRQLEQFFKRKPKAIRSYLKSMNEYFKLREACNNKLLETYQNRIRMNQQVRYFLTRLELCSEDNNEILAGELFQLIHDLPGELLELFGSEHVQLRMFIEDVQYTSGDRLSKFIAQLLQKSNIDGQAAARLTVLAQDSHSFVSLVKRIFEQLKLNKKISVTAISEQIDSAVYELLGITKPTDAMDIPQKIQKMERSGTLVPMSLAWTQTGDSPIAQAANEALPPVYSVVDIRSRKHTATTEVVIADEVWSKRRTPPTSEPRYSLAFGRRTSVTPSLEITAAQLRRIAKTYLQDPEAESMFEKAGTQIDFIGDSEKAAIALAKLFDVNLEISSESSGQIGESIHYGDDSSKKTMRLHNEDMTQWISDSSDNKKAFDTVYEAILSELNVLGISKIPEVPRDASHETTILC